MTFLPVRPIAAYVMGLALTVVLVATLPAAQGSAQTKGPAAASPAVPVMQEAQDRPDTGKGGASRPAKVSTDAQDRERRLVLLRLLVLGGGSYRPFGFR